MPLKQIAEILLKQSFPKISTALKMFSKNLARQNFEHLIQQILLFKLIFFLKQKLFFEEEKEFPKKVKNRNVRLFFK